MYYIYNKNKNMKIVIEFVKKYKTYILTLLLFIFMFRSCRKTTEVKKLNKNAITLNSSIDSLNSVVNSQRDTINNISDIIIKEKLKVHRYYDNYVSSKDRDRQLMELHMIIKNNISEIEK